jgi:hypothetical protein
MATCSDDHGHRFGLPAPVDAAAAARAAMAGATIVDARVRDGAPDLVLRFENGVTLELLALSSGYECRQTRDPSGRCLVVSGSRHASTWTESTGPRDD